MKDLKAGFIRGAGHFQPALVELTPGAVPLLITFLLLDDISLIIALRKAIHLCGTLRKVKLAPCRQSFAARAGRTSLKCFSYKWCTVSFHSKGIAHLAEPSLMLLSMKLFSICMYLLSMSPYLLSARVS